MKNFFRSAWLWVRELATDDAYERYLGHHAEAHSDEMPLSASEFYLNQQQCKWSGVQRCC
jgi:uncharacterized short protein YbdD (DUF466 family)